MPYSQVAQIREAAQRIASRCPQMRVEESILCRIAMLLGRDLVSRLNELIAPAGLAELEYRLLLILFSHGGSASPGELCGLLTQSPANLTRISNLLTARGLVTRAPHPEDRRRLVVSITPAGEKLVRDLMPCLTAGLGALFDDFTAEDRQRFLDYLLRLMRALDEVPRSTHAEQV